MTLPSVNDDVDPIPVVIPEDFAWLGGKIDQMAQAIRELSARRERPSPTIIELSVAQPTYRSSVRLRLETLIIVENAGSARPRLTIGTRKYTFQGATTQSTMVIPFPITIEAGLDVTGTGDMGSAFNADSRMFLIAYPDE